MTLYRDGRRLDVDIRLDEAPINNLQTTVAERTVHAEERLGINVETLDAELAAQLRFPRGASGVVLADVARGSPAQRRGVAQYVNFKLAQINDDPIETTDDVRGALDAIGGGEIVSLHFEDASGTVRVVNVRMPS